MGKVITSAGIQDFVATGKVENVPSQASQKVEEAAKSAQVTEASPSSSEATTAAVEAVTEGAKKGSSVEEMVQELGLEKEFSAEELKTIGERVTRSMAQRHRRMKEAQEAAAEAERFAETQFNEKRQVEREREELREKLAALEKTRAEVKAIEAKEPTIEDFKDDKGSYDWHKYSKALAKHEAEAAVARDRAEREKAQAEAAMKATEDAARARFQAAKAKYSDFEEVMGQAKDILIQTAVLDYLRESETGPDLTYYLIKHPEEVARIVKLTPTAALAAVGRLEDRIEGETSGKPKGESSNGANAESGGEKKGGAPAPITPLGAGPGIISKDPSQMNFKELRAYEAAKQRRAH